MLLTSSIKNSIPPSTKMTGNGPDDSSYLTVSQKPEKACVCLLCLFCCQLYILGTLINLRGMHVDMYQEEQRSFGTCGSRNKMTCRDLNRGSLSLDSPGENSPDRALSHVVLPWFRTQGLGTANMAESLFPRPVRFLTSSSSIDQYTGYHLNFNAELF